MSTISKHEFSTTTYVSRPLVEGKLATGPQIVRTGRKHRYTFRGEVCEIIKPADGTPHLTTLLEYAGEIGEVLHRRLEREARKRGTTPGALEREICPIVAADVEATPVTLVTEMAR